MGQCVLIVGPIAHVVVYKDIGFYYVKNFGKGMGVFSIALYKIAITVLIFGIAPKPIGFRAILIYPGGGISI